MSSTSQLLKEIQSEIQRAQKIQYSAPSLAKPTATIIRSSAIDPECLSIDISPSRVQVKKPTPNSQFGGGLENQDPNISRSSLRNPFGSPPDNHHMEQPSKVLALPLKSEDYSRRQQHSPVLKKRYEDSKEEDNAARSSPSFCNASTANVFNHKALRGGQTSDTEHVVNGRSEQMYEKIQGGLRELSDDFSRECDDLTSKIEQIMRSELLSLTKRQTNLI